MLSPPGERKLQPPVSGLKGIRELRPEEAGEGSPISVEQAAGTVIHGDALEIVDRLPDSSVDMVFLDPPYFLQLPGKDLRRWGRNDVVDAVYDDWDSFRSYEEYDGLLRSILSRVQRVMKPSATIWAISTYHSIFRVGRMMQDLGFWILNDVVWIKSNPMPNWLGVRFTNSTETLIWATRDRKSKGYVFNRDFAKRISEGKLANNTWNIPVCSGKERLRYSDGLKVHSTQKPVKLLRYVIGSSTREGDIILDPMAGTGTTGAAARDMGRSYILIEKKRAYVDQILKRLA